MDTTAVKNAMYREIQAERKKAELAEKVNEDKLLYALIKYHAAEPYQFNPLTIEKEANTYFAIVDVVGMCTPREFMRIFLIKKEFKGRKYGFKDYFSVMESIDEIGLDNKIQDGFGFLWDYLNDDVIDFFVNLMALMSAYKQLKGEGSLIEGFLKSQGEY